jgi:hypothetical protein
MQEMGLDAVADGYLEGQIWGTPQQMLEGYEQRRRVVGDFDILMISRYAGMPFECAQRTLSTFAKEVLPELKSWDTNATRAA